MLKRSWPSTIFTLTKIPAVYVHNILLHISFKSNISLQTYQIVASRVRVLGKSPIPYDPNASKVAPPPKSSSQPSSSQPSSSQTTALGLFDELNEIFNQADNQTSDTEMKEVLNDSGKRVIPK